MTSKMRVLVTGAGGFIGHHLVKFLVQKGYWVRGADIKLPEYEASAAHEFHKVDLRSDQNCLKACEGIEHVYHLAADMGGIGYISGYHASVARNNSLININMLDAAVASGVKRLFFSSTACVYNQDLQKRPDIESLKESDAYPALPEEGYGWEKLYMEKLCRYYREEHNLETRIARFHNVYGPLGTFDGGKEKVPAAICRKVALASNNSGIEVWGDGEQTRSFTYIADCVEGVHRILNSDYAEALNLGSAEMVSINQLVDYVSEIAGKRIAKLHDSSKPQGVRGRNSDNTLIRSVLNWAPSTTLKEGLKHTYAWISTQVENKDAATHSVTLCEARSEANDYGAQLAVIGLGKLGSPMAATFAARGYNVTGVDLDQSKVDAINQGRPPVVETQLLEMLDRTMGRLKATTNTEIAAKDADLIFVIVPTPSAADGRFSLDYAIPVCEQIGRGIGTNAGRPIVIITSTVMPGSCAGPIREALERSSGKQCGVDFGLIYSPEFIALGSVIEDFLNPDFYLVGESDSQSGDRIERFYKTICQNKAPVARMSFSEAELAKIAVNSYVTMKITYANTLARICEKLPGANVDKVSGAVGLDHRIGKAYLKGAIGYGGPCFPRDNVAFAKMARGLGLEAPIAEVVDHYNHAQVSTLVELVSDYCPSTGNVGILGLSYKPQTDVIEKSQAVEMGRQLADRGYSVRSSDPLAAQAHHQTLSPFMQLEKNPTRCIAEANVIVLATPWQEFKECENDIENALERGAYLIDCWRFFQHRFGGHERYIGLGIGPREVAALKVRHLGASPSVTL